MTPPRHPAGAAPAPPGVLVILGASGDLTKRLLLPALLNLASDGLLPDAFAVVGMGRSALDTAGFRARQRADIRGFATRPDFDEAAWNWLESRLHYLPGEFDDAGAFARLRAAVDEAAVGGPAAGNTLLYLAISPEFFSLVNRQLDAAGFTRLPGTRRIIVEKPFGRDLASARALNRELLAHWREEEIYRIDHYLGKETVQNLLAFRLANGMFAPLWNGRHIDHIQISAAETVGVEGRGGYYDHTGAVRDMIQNHLMQVLAYLGMEPPESLDPGAVRDAKARLLADVRPPTAADVAASCVRGQYGAGKKADGSPAVGYREEPSVDPRSATETFAALRLHLDNERWQGMPVYLRSGKALWKRGTEVVVQFRPEAGAARQGVSDAGNLLVFHIQPHQAVEIRMSTKRPGPAFALQRTGMRFDYADAFQAARGTGYEVLLHAALSGDPTLFSRTDFVERAWQIVQPVLDAWAATPPGHVPDYAAGTWGPRAAAGLLAKDGRHWHEILTRDLLARSPFFGEAPPLLLDAMLPAFRPRAAAAGETIVAAGARDDAIYFVCRGALEVLRPDGTALGAVGEGEFFGEMAVLFSTPRSATVRATADCDLLVLDGEDFRRLIEGFPAVEARFRAVAEARRRADG
ncbi:MAG: glucose-6-phosphate dehydrogenase [Planctomycetaceae bacterium]